MEMLSNPAVIWFLIGLGLLLLELVLPALVILFFGVGAWITAIAAAIFNISLNWQILIFLVASMLGLVLLRKYLRRRFFNRKEKNEADQLDEFTGKKAKAVEDFLDGNGEVEFKGTRWPAQSDGPVTKGQWVTITGQDSLVLLVKSS
jgi:membrane protein implicated in regulation of membrane protease activity